MIDKKYVEMVLKHNGTSISAPDEEIRSVLLQANFKNDDIDNSLIVLRENKNTNQRIIEEYNDVLTHDTKLGPEAIHALLGVDVEVDTSAIRETQVHSAISYYFKLMIVLMFAALFAAAALLAIMYYQQIGIFHPAFN